MQNIKRNGVIGVAAIALLATAWAVYASAPSESIHQSTDDAYLQAYFTDVAPQISGEITGVLVDDYQQVKTGDVLFELDNQQQQIAVAAAEAQLAKARAVSVRLSTELQNQSLTIQVAKNTLKTEEAKQALAKEDAVRYANMVKDGSGSRRASENAHSALVEAQGALDNARLQVQTEEEKAAIISARIQEALADLNLQRAKLKHAKLELSYTQIKAPIDGIVAQRKVRTGGYVHTGNTALTIVPTSDVFIEAHFRETQLANMRSGDEVSIRFDGLPGREFHGEVASFGPASGLSFAPVDPINATGNFTKIVQRMPVRIHFKANQQSLDVLRVGMSAVVDVTTSHTKIVRTKES